MTATKNESKRIINQSIANWEILKNFTAQNQLFIEIRYNCESIP